MKKLKKILLINWLYYSRQLIDIGDINFLTGKTGAGKSTIIDALQIVLLGELNARNFNKAANESSQRTLDGYLRADIDGTGEGTRRGKDFSSYIACEFYDDWQGNSFTIGIIFDCRNDGSRQERFFIYPGKIPDNCFIINKLPMDIPALRAYITSEYKPYGKMYDSHKDYKADVLSRWNVHTEAVFRMLKRAVSFKPIVDIQSFLTENICDTAERPNIEAMQQNIREYKRHEEIARRQEEQIEKLRDIGSLYSDLQRAVDTYQQHSFLSLWAQKEDLQEQITKLENDREANQDKIALLEAETESIRSDINAKENKKDALHAECAKSEVFQAENRLKTEKQQLIAERNRLAGNLQKTAVDIRREAQAISSLFQRLEELGAEEQLQEMSAISNGISTAFLPLLDCGDSSFSMPTEVFSNAYEKTNLFSQALRDASYKLGNLVAGIKREIGEKEAALSNLRKNVKDYPAGLLSLKRRLSDEVAKKTKRPVSIFILADLLEIADGQSSWRGAVEGYLNTQKFYLLVDPFVYDTALSIFNRIKSEYPQQSFGLVDVGKLREREHNEPWDDSLAKKIVTDNPLARDYVDYLLGRVVCCAHVSQLRKHRTSITEEGMLYQGYVARPIRKALMDDAFIGRAAIGIRSARLENELNSLRENLHALSPLYEEIEKSKNREFLFSMRFVSDEITQRQRDYLRGLEIVRDLDKVEDELSHLDLFWLDSKREEIKTLEKELTGLRKQETGCTSDIAVLKDRIHEIEYEKLPDLYQTMIAKEDKISEQFTDQFVQATGIPRYQAELKRLKKSAVVAKNFGDRLVQTENEQRAARDSLFRARSAYIQAYQPCSFAVDSPLNDEFAGELSILEESELPKYREKIKEARESALEQFQNDFLYKLQSSIEQVQDQVRNLNKALKYAQFGTEQYQFRVDRDPDYAEYYDMIMAPELKNGEGGLFMLEFQNKYSAVIEDLFGKIADSDDTQMNTRRQSELQKNIERYTDFRTYLKFDLETTDREGNKQLLSQTLNKKSGGETQTPFYIAVLASFAQLYQVNNRTPSMSNTVRLVIFDEAFNKMDSDRIVESVRLLRKMNLQAIVCTPPDKISDIMPIADKTLLVHKEKNTMRVLPFAKESADRWNGV